MVMKANFSPLAAALETASTPPSTVFPRFVLTLRDGTEYLLGPDRRPMYARRGRGLPGEPIDPQTRIPRAASERDLWNGNTSPLHDRTSGWEVAAEMRRWGVLAE